MPTTSYKARAFVEAARKLGVETVIGSNEKQALDEISPAKSLQLDFSEAKKATETIVQFAKLFPLKAIVPTDDETVILASIASQALGLTHNPVDAVLTTRNKYRFRELLFKAGISSPRFQLVSIDDDPKKIEKVVGFPCVLKPLALSASRGVIRADTRTQFVEAFDRIKAILRQPDAIARGEEEARHILMEDYLPGNEVVLEGLLVKGELRVLAIFDKPEPLEGPYFEETIYVTPSRFAPSTQDQIKIQAGRVIDAVGLKEGPIHAEFRVSEKGIYPLETAARSIGGNCSQALRFETGMTLEELILRHAIGAEIGTLKREKKASGVMMIPIPKNGVLKEIRGLKDAQAVPSIEEIKMSIKIGQPVTTLPEGSKYLGFIFARHDTPEGVEAALRAAHHRLEFVVA